MAVPDREPRRGLIVRRSLLRRPGRRLRPVGPGRRCVGLVAVAVLLCASCDGGGATISDEQYTIRQNYMPLDTIRSDSARRAALAEVGVTVEDLREYGIRHGEDTEHMKRIWEIVLERLTPDTLPDAADPEAEEPGS